MKYKLIGLTSVLISVLLVFVICFVFSGNSIKNDAKYVMADAQSACLTHDKDKLCTHLPIVKIDTQRNDIPGAPIISELYGIVGYTTGEDEATTVSGKIEIIENNGANNHITDKVKSSSDIKIRVRGHSSRSFDKKNYFIRLVNSDETNNPQEILGMDAHHEWALHGPFLDKTLIRNYMWYAISGKIMDYSPDARFCEVFINDEYMGVYVMTETITAGKNGARLGLEVNKKDNTFGGYLFRLDWGDSEKETFISPYINYTKDTINQHEIVYPGVKNLTEELKENIKNDISAFEKMLYSYDFANRTYGYEKYIDTSSFVDYFLINEITCNYDAGVFSTYIYKDTDGLYKMCVWDFNSACDMYQEMAMPHNTFQMQERLWFEMLIKDEKFTNRIIKRYKELRKTYFSKEYLYSFIDSTVEDLEAAIDRNYEVWGYSFLPENNILSEVERNPKNYDEAIAQLKTFLDKRIDWLDNNIDSLRQYSAQSKVKEYYKNNN